MVKHGFLILRPVKSIIDKVLFVVKASASFFRPPSSVTSLFLERFKLVIPEFLPSSVANFVNPESVKLFLEMSRF